MKLFGGKKQAKNVEPAAENTSNVIAEVIPEAAPEVEAPAAAVIEIVPEVTEAREEGVISSIAGAFGIPEEELKTDPAQVAAEVSGAFEAAKAAEQESKKKLTRAEKKAAKAEAKEAAKVAKAAEKQAAKQAKKDAKRAKKEAKKWSFAKKLVFTVVMLIALGTVGFAGYFVSEMWVTNDKLDIYEADFAGEIIMSNTNYENLTDPGADVEVDEIDSTRKKGCYTFLVAARDVESGCTDVIITGRFDTVNGTINMVSIPRDTMINKGNLKVNTAYQGDLASGGNGIDGLLKEMKKLLGYDIDSYAIVDVEAAEKLIDAIGGVYFDVPFDMHYEDGAQGLIIDLDKGYQKLSGSDAVKLLRFRKGYANGDLGRIETQHAFIMALAEQMLDVGNIPNLGAAIDIYKEHVQSNLSAGNILFYAKNFLEMDMSNIQFVDMPQMRGGLVDGQSFIFVNPTKWVNVINDYLNPYKEEIKQSHLNIKTSGDGGETFMYTGGGR